MGRGGVKVDGAGCRWVGGVRWRWMRRGGVKVDGEGCRWVGSGGGGLGGVGRRWMGGVKVDGQGESG